MNNNILVNVILFTASIVVGTIKNRVIKKFLDVKTLTAYFIHTSFVLR